MHGLTRIRTIGLGAVLVGSMAAGGLGIVMAQDAEIPAHPAHIHAGTCDDLDPNPKAPLSYVSVLQNEGDDPGGQFATGRIDGGPRVAVRYRGRRAFDGRHSR